MLLTWGLLADTCLSDSLLYTVNKYINTAQCSYATPPHFVRINTIQFMVKQLNKNAEMSLTGGINCVDARVNKAAKMGKTQ